MVSPETRKQYTATIGIECHVQLKTKTKLFSAVDNDARGAKPNTLISHIDLGMPGALPVLNEKAVEYAMRMAFAFNTEPQKYSYFERKHYFYPDLPKGYQITQLSHPIVKGGYVEIDVDGEARRIHLNRVQMEEDAGKNTHPAGKDYTLVDLNRAGTPLLEIVSEPDIHTSAEAKAYAKELYLLARYTGVSDADMYHGNMRFDVNVSVSKVPGELGTRTETKNLNSFRSVEKAVEYEINRQIELLEKDQAIVQETRGWNDAKQQTFSQRGKEEAHDYRYFPEPDLPPLMLEDKMIENVKTSMPVLPAEWRRRLRDLGLNTDRINTLLDGELENEEIELLAILESNMQDRDKVKFLANWSVNVVIPLLHADKFHLSNHSFRTLTLKIYELVTAGNLSSTAAKNLFSDVAAQKSLPDDIEKYVAEQGYIQVSDEDEISKIVADVLAANSKAAEDVKNGEMKAIGFLVGQVMKASRGKANPGLAQDLIKKQLGV